jgi:hypothetical protein
VATATVTACLALALAACGHGAPLSVAVPAAAVMPAVVAEAPAHRLYVAPVPVLLIEPVSPVPTPSATAVPPTAAPAAVPAPPAVPASTRAKAVPKAAAPAAPAAATPTSPAAVGAAAVVPPPSRPSSYRGVPVIYADPDGYPGAWGTASAQAIWVYPAAPARYVGSVMMHEYMHVLEFRAGWKDVASSHGERVADAGEQLLGGSYFKYTQGAPTASELAEARRLLGL